MAGFTDRTSQGILNHILGKTSIFSRPTAYVALFSAVGTDAGTGFTELVGGSYARVATAAGDWNSASGTGPSTDTNANPITFTPATADWPQAMAIGIFDALSSGNLLAWDYLGADPWKPAFVTNASPGVFNCAAHLFAVNDKVAFSTEIAGTAPTFSQSNFTGVLVVAHAATDTFDVTNSATQVNTSSTGGGLVRKITPVTVNSGTTLIFSAGQITVVSA